MTTETSVTSATSEKTAAAMAAEANALVRSYQKRNLISILWGMTKGVAACLGMVTDFGQVVVSSEVVKAKNNYIANRLKDDDESSDDNDFFK